MVAPVRTLDVLLEDDGERPEERLLEGRKSARVRLHNEPKTWVSTQCPDNPALSAHLNNAEMLSKMYWSKFGLLGFFEMTPKIATSL